MQERYCFTIWLSQTRKLSAASSPSLSQTLQSGLPSFLPFDDTSTLCTVCSAVFAAALASQGVRRLSFMARPMRQ